MKTKPRPIIEWLNELPELIREAAIKEHIKNKFPFQKTAYSMSSAIMRAFKWNKSQLGFDFWAKLYRDALYHEQNNLKLPK